ncbi:glycosyltransferase [Chitinophaga varians]|uniref:Glycosyltransferase n=1 Tax=Chitinophaga varians TaxID=2202339 RepID=A0A847S150_9BACT|nr:glycosyltransferase [Chitinophaga varians]NLR67125.1 glycosyltransferase [Chitinophaga varians]
MSKTNGQGKIRLGFFFDGGEGGGVVEYVRLLLTNIDRSRFTAIGIYLGNGPSHEALKHIFDETAILTDKRLVNVGSGKTRMQRLKMNTSKLLTAVKGTRLLARAMKKYRIDIMDVNYFPLHILAGIASRMTGVPCLWHWHGAGRPTGMRANMTAFGARFFCDKIASITHFVHNSLPEVARKKSELVYNGVDTTKISSSVVNGHLMKLAGVDENTTLVGILGTVSPFKGHTYFIKAADIVLRQYPDVRFVIIGRESATQKIKVGFEAQLRKEVKEMNREQEILFLGYVADPYKYLRDCKIICTPTIPYMNFLGEGFGLAAAECMAAGVAVVATKLGSFPEIIEHGKNGLLTEPKDADALASAIMELLADEPKRKNIATAARQHIAENFDIKGTSRKMEQLYERLV